MSWLHVCLQLFTKLDLEGQLTWPNVKHIHWMLLTSMINKEKAVCVCTVIWTWPLLSQVQCELLPCVDSEVLHAEEVSHEVCKHFFVSVDGSDDENIVVSLFLRPWTQVTKIGSILKPNSKYWSIAHSAPVCHTVGLYSLWHLTYTVKLWCLFQKYC